MHGDDKGGLSGLVHLTGSVYRAASDSSPAPVAVKVLPAPFDRAQRDQFDADRTRLGRLRHVPAILQIDDLGALDDGRPYVVSELCADSVAALLARGERLDAEEVTAVGAAVAAGLAAAHSAGVLHGRITPANLLVRASGQPVLADFGPAVRSAQADEGEYAAPETLRDGTVSPASDLYGLGATLHAALTGSPPFPARVGEHPSERVLRALREPPPPVDPALAPPRLAGLLAELLAADPAARPGDAVRVAGRLEAMLARREEPARPVDRTEQTDLLAELEAVERATAAAPRAPEPFLEVLEEPPAEPVRRTAPSAPSPSARRLVTAAKAAAAAALLVAGVLLTRQIGTEPSLAAAPPTPEPSATPADVQPSTPATVQLTEVKVVDRGRKVTLAWQGPPGMSYAVIVASAGQQTPAAKIVNQARTKTFEIQPGRAYCFQVQGSFDGVHAVQSAAKGVNGATCES